MKQEINNQQKRPTNLENRRYRESFGKRDQEKKKRQREQAALWLNGKGLHRAG